MSDDLTAARAALGLLGSVPPVVLTQEANAARIAALEAEVARLRAGLAGLRKTAHRHSRIPEQIECMSWYELPCSCGVDDYNARIDALLQETE